MQKTGIIQSITPDGGYSGQNGYINTFQMIIQAGNETIQGQIGAKTNVYPLAVGAEISVNVENTQNGVRLRKFNPQYEQQNQQQGQHQQAPPTQPHTPSPQQQQRPPQQGRDFHKENSGKCMLKLLEAELRSGKTALSISQNNEEMRAIHFLVQCAMDGIPANLLSQESNQDPVNFDPNEKFPDDIPY